MKSDKLEISLNYTTMKKTVELLKDDPSLDVVYINAICPVFDMETPVAFSLDDAEKYAHEILDLIDDIRFEFNATVTDDV